VLVSSRRIVALVCGIAALLSLWAPPARAQGCSRAAVFTLPGVTWAEVDRVRPPNLLELVEQGSAGSVSVRTISSRTSYASGFATLGAGSRLDAPRAAGSSAAASVSRSPETDIAIEAVEVLERFADDAGYNAAPGALASALDVDVAAVGNSDPGLDPPTPAGHGRWATLAAMDEAGTVDRAWVGPDLLVEDATAPFGVRTDEEAMDEALDGALEDPCAVTFIDPGDLTRVDEWALATDTEQPDAREDALLAADRMLGITMDSLDEADLLIVVSPTSPWWDEEIHLGVGVARGPGFDPGTTLESASTRRASVVTLPDVAPTILDHFDVSPVPAMTGRTWFAVPASGDPVATAVDFDDESIFVEGFKGPVSTAYVIVQVLVYLLAIFVLTRNGNVESRRGLTSLAEITALAIVAFPMATYAAGAFDGHALGTGGYILLLVGLDAVAVAGAVFVSRDPLDRLLVLTSATVLLLFLDLFTGGRLQINTVLGYSPVVAGRFAGLGNIAFAVLGTASLLTGVLVAHKWREKSWALPAVAALFVATVIVDGAAPWGSDVGGILALVPSLGVTWLLLADRKPDLKIVLFAGIVAVVAVGAFLAFDLARPSDEQTHLARLFDDVRLRGWSVLWDTIERKIEANIRLFRTSIWTFFVPPALVAMALLMRRPRGRWQAVAARFPRLRAGLVGGLVLAVVGFAVNDSGIVIPAVVLSFLVPTAVLTHLKLDLIEAEAARDAETAPA
jgi:hypothetical protein